MTRSVTAQPAPGGDQGPGSVAIALTGVTKRFGDSTAVNSVTLEIYDNEFFSILGPSGCGKTTLMRCLIGELAPDAGTISFPAVSKTLNWGKIKQAIGYVPQGADRGKTRRG